MINRLIAIAAIMITASGCTTPEITRLGDQRDYKSETYLATFDAQKRASVIHISPQRITRCSNPTENTNTCKEKLADDIQEYVRVISEPPPDVIVTSVVDLLGKMDFGKAGSAGSASGELKANIAQSVTELGKRTAAVNILRDALYRLQEMRNNNHINSDEIGLFEKILAAATTIAKSDETTQKALLFKEASILATNLKGMGADQKALSEKILNSLPEN
jgi:hypothetical protein